MKTHALGIAEGGGERLRKAIELRVRKRHERELAATKDHWRRIGLEVRIRKEVKDEMRRVASPYSLWSSS